MQNTTHYLLNKPEATDPYDIGNENDNMDILDSALYTHSTALGTGSSAGHNKVIDNLTKTSFANGEALSAHMGNSLGAMMAPIVTGPNYPSGITKKGDQFVYNGRLCVVTANTVSTSTAINVGSGGNASYASPITSQISDVRNSLDSSKAAKVFTHITNMALPYLAVNIVCNQTYDGTLFMLYTDFFGNVFIFHGNLTTPPDTLTQINDGPLITWINKATNNVNIFWAKHDNSHTRIKLSFPTRKGVPVISVTQLDYADANLIDSWSYSEA